MKGTIDYNNKDVLAKIAPIQCHNKMGKKTIVERTPLAPSKTNIECK